MAELAQAKMTCGYYDIADIIDGIRIGEHTYGRAPDAKVKFQCYGGAGQPKGKHPVYPARFARGHFPNPWIGKSEPMDLEMARYIAANGSAGWKGRSDYDRRSGGNWYLGDCSGIVYGILGVCHQMANSIFTAAGKAMDSPLVWPPSFYGTVLIYGPRGERAYTRFPVRLIYLHSMYPKDSPVLMTAEQTGAAAMIDRVETPEQRWEDLRAFFGDDFVRDGAREAFLAADQAFLARKRELDRALLAGTERTDGFASRTNAEAGRYFETISPLVRSDIAEGLQSGGAALVEPALMQPADRYRELGETLLKS
ncbi:MAG: hypothetical protein IPF96_04955 [Rhodobacter sp.]|nr:hypothetical protein [Rhodobacter sp.]